MGFDEDWPSAAYEDVIESMTDWAFSWPISGSFVSRKEQLSRFKAYADSSPRRFVDDYVHCYELYGRSSSRV